MKYRQNKAFGSRYFLVIYGCRKQRVLNEVGRKSPMAPTTKPFADGYSHFRFTYQSRPSPVGVSIICSLVMQPLRERLWELPNYTTDTLYLCYDTYAEAVTP